MPKVRKIHVRPQDSSVFQQGESGTTTGLRVAAYARVSTEQESQSNSFQAQKDYYEKLIATTPGWIYAGIYADRGISGTSSSTGAAWRTVTRPLPHYTALPDTKVSQLSTKKWVNSA